MSLRRWGPAVRDLTAYRAAALGAVAGLMAAASPAAAQVLSIGDDGAVTTYSGPAVYTAQGVRSLAPQPSAQPARATPQAVSAAIQDAASRYAVSRPLAEAVAWQESRFNQAALSPKGAVGVMQLMPTTAKTLGVDPTDLRGNVDGGVAYLSRMLRRFEGDLPRALAAYNAGPEAVDRYRGVPPYAETQAYVKSVLSHLAVAASPLKVAE